jgi:general secretion pathway protein D
MLKFTTLQAVYSALVSDSRFKVVSSPTLRVKSGSAARLMVGSDTPVITSNQLDRNGNAVQSVEYRSAGVILDVTPEARELVTDLQVRQQISNFVSTTSGVNNSPTLMKREFQTNVSLRADDVLVLGGLDQDQSSGDKSGLPWLPSWLGLNGQRHQKSEILLLMQVQRL